MMNTGILLPGWTVTPAGSYCSSHTIQGRVPDW
jgi:hypothetical protein